MYRPVPAPGFGTQVGVRVDGVRMADQLQHGQVVAGVAVGGAARQVQALAPGEGRDRRGLGLAVQQAADQPPGVDAVRGLRDRAQRARQPQPLGDDRGQLHRGRGDQPDPLAGPEVALGQLTGAFPDPVGHGLVEDLVAQADDVGHFVPGYEGQRGLPGRVDVPGVLRPPEPEGDLPPGHPGQVTGAEHLACGEPAGEVVDGGTADQRVVHVEEGARGRVGLGRGLDNGGDSRGRGARQRRLFPAHPGGSAQPEGSGAVGKLVPQLPHACRVYKPDAAPAGLVIDLVRIMAARRAP